MITFHDVEWLIVNVACVFFLGCYPAHPQKKTNPWKKIWGFCDPHLLVTGCWVSDRTMEPLESYSQWMNALVVENPHHIRIICQYKTEINLSIFSNEGVVSQWKKSVQTYPSFKFLNELSPSQIHRNIEDLHFCPKSGWCFSRENEATFVPLQPWINEGVIKVPSKKNRDDSLPGRSHQFQVKKNHQHFLNSGFACRVLQKMFFSIGWDPFHLYLLKTREIFTTTFLIFQLLHLKDLQEHPRGKRELVVSMKVFP